MASKSTLVRVPATAGGFAGARNTAAVAIDASLNVKVTQRFDGRVSIRYFGEHGERIPRNRSNLVVQALEAALRSKEVEFAGGDFEIYSSVPVGVGLGSSTAAVLAGVMAADRLYQLELSEKKLLDLASIYESRADSLGAAWLGGFVTWDDNGAHRQSVVPDEFILDVVIPEGFVEKRVPGLDEALQVQAPGLLGVFVCGAGPAVGVLAKELTGAVRLVQECFTRHGVETRHIQFHASNSGAREWNTFKAITLPRVPALGVPARKISLIPV